MRNAQKDKESWECVKCGSADIPSIRMSMLMRMNVHILLTVYPQIPVLPVGLCKHRPDARPDANRRSHDALGLLGTHEDETTVLFKTISLDGIKPNTNPKTNFKTNPNTNTNPIQLLYAFFEHRPLIFSLPDFCTHRTALGKICLLYTSPSPRD